VTSVRVRPTRAVATLAAVSTLAAFALAGCSGGSGGGSGAGATTTGRATATSTVRPSGSATTKPASTDAVSTVKGRKYDAGVITGSKKAGGLTVLVLNRYTVKGLSDAKLAADGAPISPHSDVRFSDQNKGKTYLVPVNPSAPIVVNTCDSSGGTPTMTSTPVTLAAFLARANRAKTIVLLSYDDLGRLTRLDTDPAC
jgi:hypothetical protein